MLVVIRVGVGSGSFLSIFWVINKIRASSTKELKFEYITGFLEFVLVDFLNRICDKLHETLVFLEDLNCIIHVNDQEYDLEEGDSDLNWHLFAQEHLSGQPESKDGVHSVIQLCLLCDFLNDLLIKLSFCSSVLLLGSH